MRNWLVAMLYVEFTHYAQASWAAVHLIGLLPPSAKLAVDTFYPAV